MTQKKDIDHKEKKSSTEINNLKKEIENLKTGWMRTQADFENYRKKTELLKADWICQANLDLILKLLPIIDNFKRASTHVPENLKNNDWTKGIGLIEKQMQDVLNQEGLTQIDTKPGNEFDPNIHEAVSCEKNDKIKPDHIIDVIEIGYKLGSQIIRPAKVRVSKS